MKDDRERRTLENYSDQSESFWKATKEHDVRQNIDALLSRLPANKPMDILDLGCGPGRDLLAFKQLGHHAVGVDGSLKFCKMAKDYSDCPVINESFLSLSLQAESFDGIFANASLFHIPSEHLLEFLQRCYAWLKKGGVLMMSMPRGSFEGFRNDRYVHLMEFAELSSYLKQAGFNIVSSYYRPAGLPIDQQSWLAVVNQK